MADELGDKLKSLLSNPETLNMFSSLLGNMGSNQNEANSSPSPSGSDDEFVSNIKNAMASINTGSDKRINLLNALKPYMRQSRASNIDRAVKMIKLSQLTSLFKDL